MNRKFLSRDVVSCVMSVLTILVFLPIPLLAQECPLKQNSLHLQFKDNQILPPGTIDGSKNPELIPDVVAYRLFFVALATPPAPTADQRRAQAAKLLRIGLSAPDSTILISTLTTFYSQYADFRYAENDAANQARAVGLPIDFKASMDRRDALVQKTLTELTSALTPAGVRGLDAHVQQEKTGMKIVPLKGL